MQRIFFNFILALEGVGANRLRAILTALGIVFGVAAVIAMLAIGSGAKQAILEQMKLIGTNNIVIEAVVPQEEDEITGGNADDASNKNSYTPGLTLKDAEAIQQVLPTVESVSPEIVLTTSVIQSGKLQRTRVIGVTNAFFDLNNIEIGQGTFFNSYHFDGGRPVCIIGEDVRAKFFSEEEPLGKLIKSGDTWMTVIGVLKRRMAKKENLEALGIRDYNSDIYIPIQTALLRFKNRALVTKAALRQNTGGDVVMSDEEEPSATERKEASNYHQLDRLVIRVKNSDNLQATATVIARMLNRRHEEVKDYNIHVPELLLQQQQKTQDTFNLVLAVIAGISLLVGGIGIMNIMLASVLERIKEIGIRRSLGATRSDIVYQFLFESVVISLLGGLLGVFLGVGSATAIANAAEIPTVVSTWSIVLSFGVAATIGLIFGIIPARRAAYFDPIKALRND
ncbi:MAG: putative ABC transport system permease protein [Saprospiraceae bacterium]|jgi:putative ABC transport system permease protein